MNINAKSSPQTKKRPRLIIRLMLSLAILAIVAWGAFMLYHEVLTAHHLAEFDLEIAVFKDWFPGWQTGEFRFKVLQYTAEAEAAIYAYSAEIGLILNFSWQNNAWQYQSWDALWSQTGSADQFVWPYLHHTNIGRVLIVILLLLLAPLAIFRGLRYGLEKQKGSQQ